MAIAYPSGVCLTQPNGALPWLATESSIVSLDRSGGNKLPEFAIAEQYSARRYDCLDDYFIRQ